MIYKIGILGITGRMGLEISQLLANDYSLGDSHLELADAVASSGRITSVEGVDVRKLEDPPREPVHAWIDFSRPEGTMKLLESIDTPILIGTTGFDVKQLDRIDAYSKRHPVILASNTSPGMNLLFKLLTSLPLLDWVHEVRVAEEHHKKKKDAPSGTAKELIRILESKGFQNLQVHVTRAGTLPGTHSVHLYGEGEEIQITHRVNDRRVFADGALRGILYLLKQKNPGFYSLVDRNTY